MNCSMTNFDLILISVLNSMHFNFTNHSSNVEKYTYVQ